ncbi:MAG TPA: peptidylprolyl isomerase, partial [Saprospiraceae bacterium]|nr:peptidylprolyl isomerase [Saprospiraceae bacterium]
MMRLLFLFLVAGYFLHCTPPPPADASKTGKVNLNLNDPLVQNLYNLRDERKVDSLRRYLGDKDATLRYLAALSFASFRDSNMIQALVPLLRDSVEDVRIAAAFSLGQIGVSRCEKPLIDAFIPDDTLSIHQRFNAVVLEAVGKCGSRTSLKHITAVTKYYPTDTLLVEGQCRAVYRFGQRDSVTPEGTALMVRYVQNDKMPESARLMAAHYLARTKGITIDSQQVKDISVAFIRASNHPGIRMAIATALGKSVTPQAFNRLSSALQTEQDWRVKCNLINALAKFEYDTVRAIVTPFLRDPNPHISRTAAAFFVNNGQIKDGDYYWRITMDHPDLPIPVQILLHQASVKYLSGKPQTKDFVNGRLQGLFAQGKTPYDRADCLRALAEFGWNYRFIHDRGFTDPHPAVKTAAAEALVTILKKPNFYAVFGENAKGVRRELYYNLREIVAAGDPGMIAEGAEGFRVEAMNFKTLRDTSRINDFRAALAKLRLPRDVEAFMALDKAISYLEGRPEPPKPVIPYNHPVDWETLKLVTQKTEATIETAKGKIVLELYPTWAPGSVANFLRLAADGFFKDKNFHRVVPNFVVQGGCPRGDGYGALDYSIRTEIGLAWYDGEGYLGMASAGLDTEGTQFFITHSATPHLDGRYTIFGKVKSGMDVVNQILPGDVITGVTVQ